MKLILSFTFLISLLFFDFSIAHGPSRQKVIESIEINASPQKVWSMISDFSNYNWHPDVKSFSSDGKEIGSKRIINFSENKKISQTLEKLNYERKIISWRILETDNSIMPVNSYSATLSVSKIEGNDNKSNLKFKAAFYRGFMGNDPPEELNDENSKKKVLSFVNKSLKGIKSKLE
ncbi:MAG: hypothetical protein CMK56_02405 [Proteobacteria bacterium]|nr:hypothetical protein [Pseudomonadota bacterium]